MDELGADNKVIQSPLEDAIKEELSNLDAMHNVEPPEGWEEEFAEQLDEDEGTELPEGYEYADIREAGIDDVPYREDEVKLYLSPEEIVVLIQTLRAQAVAMNDTGYFELVEMNRYDEQGYYRTLSEKLHETLNFYKKHRQYHPFASQWAKKLKNEFSL